MHRMLYGPGPQIVLNGLGGYPPVNGQCWAPVTSNNPTAHWVDAVDKECPYAPPGTPPPTGPGVPPVPATTMPVVATTGWWAAIPMWVKVVGAVGLGFLGYKLYTAQKK